MDSLASKTLVMIVGPTAIGKSSFMNKVLELDPQFKRVKSFTTRLPRGNDELNQYFYITQEQLDAHLEAGEVLTDAIFPTTGIHYGTVPQSYQGDYNLLDTLASSVQDYRALPFHTNMTVSLTTDPDAWASWLQSRYPQPSEERTKRLQEARLSVTWSLEQTTDHCWIKNEPNDMATSATQLIDLVFGKGKPVTEPPKSATDMLNAIDNLLSLG